MSEENEKPAVSEEIAAAAALEDINIEESMSRDYIDYSMSVIVGRALPDARDGMKPVHRRFRRGAEAPGKHWDEQKRSLLHGGIIPKNRLNLV